jgi:hypothetical protein
MVSMDRWNLHCQAPRVTAAYQQHLFCRHADSKWTQEMGLMLNFVMMEPLTVDSFFILTLFLGARLENSVDCCHGIAMACHGTNCSI